MFTKLLISNVQRGKVYNNVNHGTSKTVQKQKRNPKLRSKFNSHKCHQSNDSETN